MTAKIPLVAPHCQCQLVFKLLIQIKTRRVVMPLTDSLNPSELEQHDMHDGLWSKMVEQEER